MKAGLFLVSLGASIVLATASPSHAQISDELHGHWELAESMDYVEPSHTIYPPEERQPSAPADETPCHARCIGSIIGPGDFRGSAPGPPRGLVAERTRSAG
jgi:hypothetical protein